MPIEFPSLPYALNALEPFVSSKTLKHHHGKHHRGYVQKLNSAISGTSYEGMSLEDIIFAAHANSETGIFNNAAQAWNHTFFWSSLSPDGGGEPRGPLADAIEDRFGSAEKFGAEFKAAALAQFGSGWTWLVCSDTGIEILSTSNADTPLLRGSTPLLTLDVWEHAYYLDFQNRRDAYIDAILSNIINWDFAAENFQAGC
ncbi:MAG: superoxide dismutase [Gammaproteobacteria bacterium]|nr:superoxide dismutase [Gammaproteobacteria bacterium]